MVLIDDNYNQAKSLMEYLTNNRELSMLSYIEPTLRKNFLLQCASFHEDEIMELLKEFATTHGQTEELVNFVKRFLIERQYDRLIDFKNNNINQFISLFGDNFKVLFLRDISSIDSLSVGVSSFLELGRLRNLSIHGNLANFNLDLTIDDIYRKHNEAMVFIQHLKTKLA